MTEFIIPVKITKYQKLSIQAETLDDVKVSLAKQLYAQKVNFEFVDFQEAELVEPKPELLLEVQLDLPEM